MGRWFSTTSLPRRRGCCSVGFVGGEQRGVHRLHAGRAGEGAHQPGVDAVDVVDVKAGQESNGVAELKIHHADHTLFHFLLGGVGARVEDTSGQMLDEADTLGDADLFLLRQLAGQTTLAWRGVIDRQRLRVLLVGRRGLSGQTPPLRVVQQRQVIRSLRKQTVPHRTESTMRDSTPS